MLVLTRKCIERIIVGENLEVEVLEIRGTFVRLGIRARREVRVVRLELCGRAAATEPVPVQAASSMAASSMAASQIAASHIVTLCAKSQIH